MDVTLKNVSGGDLHIGDLYRTFADQEEYVYENASLDWLSQATSIKEAVANGDMTAVVAYSADDDVAAVQAILPGIRGASVPASADAVITIPGPSTGAPPFADMPEMVVALTTKGNAVKIEANAEIVNAAGGLASFQLDVDGAPFPTSERDIDLGPGLLANLSYTIVVPGLAAGAHTFKIQWGTAAGVLASTLLRRAMNASEIA